MRHEQKAILAKTVEKARFTQNARWENLFKIRLFSFDTVSRINKELPRKIRGSCAIYAPRPGLRQLWERLRFISDFR